MGPIYYSTGTTLYAVLDGTTAGEVWSVDLSAFETLDTHDRSTYAVALTESPASSGKYYATLPGGLSAYVEYPITVYLQAGGLPDAADDMVATSSTGPVAANITAVNGAATTDLDTDALAETVVEKSFTYDATATYLTANAGSLVKQIADNSSASGLTEAGIAAAVRDVDNSSPAANSLGESISNADTQAANIIIAIGTPSVTVSDDIASIEAKTTNLPASPAAVGSAMTLTSGERDAIAGAIFKLDLSTLSGEATYSLLNAIRKLRNKWSISGTTLTVYGEDGVTAKYTQTLTATAGASPITGTS